MPLLHKCNVTNLAINDDSSEVFACVVVPTRYGRQHPTFTAKIKDLKSGKELTHHRSYASRTPCMINYTPVGLFFKGKLSEYGELDLDFDDEDNIRHMGRFIEYTQYEIVESQSSSAYDPKKAKELFEKEDYHGAWQIIIESLRMAFYDEHVFMKGQCNEMLPVSLSYIRKDAFDKMMSEEVQKRIYSEFFRQQGDILLKERQSKAKDILEFTKQREHKFTITPCELRGAMNDTHHYFRDNDELKLFSGRHRDTLCDHVLGDILNDIEWKDYTDNEVNDKIMIDVLQDAMLLEYVISFFDYMQIEFSQANIVSIEDYQNYYTNKYLEFITPIYEQEQDTHREGYDSLIDQVTNFYEFKQNIYASYVEGGALEKLVEEFGPIDEYLLKETDSNTVIFYDTITERYDAMEDHVFMTYYKEKV